MKMKRLNNLLFVAAILAAGCLFVFDKADTATQSGSVDINVQMTVPSNPPESIGFTDSIAPVISDVTSTAGSATATVSWTATDNMGVQNCSFQYGPSLSYGLTAAPGVSGSNYSVDLSGLASGTAYYYSIQCVDFASNSANATGAFATLSPAFTGKLFLIAKPEKRVSKAGGNLAMNGILRLYNPSTKALVFSAAAVFGNAGSSTLQNEAIPTGNFIAVLKGESHLAKKIINVTIENGRDSTLDFSESGHYFLLAGDVQGAGDNLVDILDVSAEDIKFNSREPMFDLNRDGIVDVLDMSAILVNYSKRGDAV